MTRIDENFETKETIEAKLKDIAGSICSLDSVGNLNRAKNSGWKRKNVREVRHNLVSRYFTGDLAGQLHTAINLDYLQNHLQLKFYAMNSIGERRGVKQERLLDRIHAVRHRIYEISEYAGTKMLTLFKTAKNASKKHRLLLGDILNLCFPKYFGGRGYYGLVRYSDGDGNGKTYKGLEFLGLDRLVVLSEAKYDDSMYIPKEVIKKAYAAASTLPKGDLDKEYASIRRKIRRLVKKREEYDKKLELVGYAEQYGIPVGSLVEKMPSLIEDIEKIKKSYSNALLEKIVLDPNTGTMAFMFERSLRGRGVGKQKVIVASRNGRYASRDYTYRDPNSADYDDFSYCFSDISINSVNGNEVSLGLKSRDLSENVLINLGGS